MCKVFFFCCAPLGVAATFRRGQSKRKHHPGCCFLLRPRGMAGEGGARAKKKNREGEAPLGAGTGPEQKKTPPRVVFFFWLRPRGKAGEGEAPLGAGTGPEQKKNTPRPRADADSLTAGLGGDASPSPGCFFFFAAAPPGPGCCFCCGPARTLTHSLWAGAISARPGCFFFLLRPRRVFLDNNKKCLGYYIGSKMTRRGHSKKKKNTTSVGFGGGHE